MNLANHFVHTREAQLPQNFECNDQRDNKPAQRSDANDRIKVDCALSLVSPNSHNHLLPILYPDRALSTRRLLSAFLTFLALGILL